MFERKSETPLPSLCSEQYGGLAYDGCHFYLTVRCECLVLQLSPCFEREQCFKTRRTYCAICYDFDKHCFWASADGGLSTLYKLNESFEEIDCIMVRSPRGCRDTITGVSFQCCHHRLLVSFAEGIMRVNPDCPCESEVIVTAKCEWFWGVVSLCPYILCYCIESGTGSIRIYSHCGELLHKTPVPFDFELESAVFWPCVKDCLHCHFCVLSTKHCAYPYLCDYVLTCDAICDTICPCNYELCRDCPNPEPCHDACQDVLESIALMEAALAHILNAEGEKIQKIVAATDDPCKMLAVNESVNKTLSKAIYLEQLLCCKLESLGECCDFCTHDEPCE